MYQQRQRDSNREYQRQMEEYKRELHELRSGYVTALIILFQVLMGFACTTGVLLFFTGGTGTHLRSWLSYDRYEVAVFIAFALNVVVQTFNVVVAVYSAYRNGFVRHLKPGAAVRRFVIDALFTTCFALTFFLLALTLATIRTDPLMFFYIYGILLVMYSMYNVARLVVGVRPRVGAVRGYLVDTLLNLTVAGIGAVLILSRVPFLNDLLLALVLVETVRDGFQALRFP